MIDINAEQRRASNPLSSVWVAASAGSGKTKVLTDRVLNLLLMTGRPEKLLCLTFTKAAAAEMANRINDILKKWVTCSEKELIEQIQDLSGETPTSEVLTRARRLFAEVLETPGGMKIMTIHAFCQSVLTRFPLEAGISPHFEIIDDIKADALLNDALKNVLESPDFQEDVALLSEYQTRSNLIDLLQKLFSSRSRLLKLRDRNSLSAIIQQIKQYFNIAKFDTAQEIIADSFPEEEWSDIRKKYLKKDDTVFDKLANNEIAQKAEEVAQNLRHFRLVELTQAVLHLAYTILERYQLQKNAAGLMDFEDLISTTKSLLEKSHAAAWVLFKLDGGIDHILVDEAQDTNPEQWNIIRMITDEFFSGEDHHDTMRTLFVVGDKKQSIYRFQGADPDIFEKMRFFFERKIRDSQNNFEPVSFNLSFRSTQPVLDMVNLLLSNPEARTGILNPGEEAVHIPHRTGEAGLVEVWPLIPVSSQPDNSSEKPALSLLAEKIADKIASMIKNKEILESQARPVQAGDFLILVQRRNALMSELVRLLKDRYIPVMGIDRLDLSKHIAVQDLIATAKFALLPEDDLNLACLIKSPLVKMTEDELFQTAYNRGNMSLWEALQIKFPNQATYLKKLLSQADKVPPYEFFAQILGPMGGRKAFQERLGSEALEAIDEFLNLVMAFERDEIPSLQRFIDSLAERKTEVKRDMESGVNAVRIMTVHASKGLQGNIVFLPQTRYLAPHTPKFLWLNHELPLWLPNKEMSSIAVDRLLDEEAQKLAEENRRLLYVAVTRARDRLYICGYEAKKKVQPGNWYDLIKNSLKDYSPDADGIIRIRSEQEKAVDVNMEETNMESPPLPDWVWQPAPIEPTLPKALSPSDQGTQENENSPLTEGEAQALARGTFIHRLLQYLPTVSQEKWPIVIKRLQPPGVQLPDAILSLLKSETFSVIFGKDSLSEVPVVGVLQGQSFSGQIDRLVVLPSEVWIIDFKTNRHVPESVVEIPEGYKKQLSIYRGLISGVFSDKLIRTYILWTENLTLMEIKHEI